MANSKATRVQPRRSPVTRAILIGGGIIWILLLLRSLRSFFLRSSTQQLPVALRTQINARLVSLPLQVIWIAVYYSSPEEVCMLFARFGIRLSLLDALRLQNSFRSLNLNSIRSASMIILSNSSGHLLLMSIRLSNEAISILTLAGQEVPIRTNAIERNVASETRRVEIIASLQNLRFAPTRTISLGTITLEMRDNTSTDQSDMAEGHASEIRVNRGTRLALGPPQSSSESTSDTSASGMPVGLSPQPVHLAPLPLELGQSTQGRETDIRAFLARLEETAAVLLEQIRSVQQRMVNN